MKKIILIASVLFATFSCSSKEEEPDPFETVVDYDQMAKEYEEFRSENPVEKPKEDLAVRGLALIESSDCLSCHTTATKMIGPSYQEVADRYTDADIDYLANKIIDGGKGVWGDIPMTAHPGVNKENARQMVKYILSLKK